MADTQFVDVGDELVVRISGYPVGKAVVDTIDDRGVLVAVEGHDGGTWFWLPLDFQKETDVDGVAHETN